MIHDVKFGQRTFQIDVQFMERKQLTITVHPNMLITAKAPIGFDKESIRQRLQKKASWIARQLDFFEQYHPPQPARRYVNGETHYYMGRQYRLKIREGRSPRVRLIGRFFDVEIPDPENRAKIQKSLQKWYDRHAREWLAKRVREHLPEVKRRGASNPDIRYRRMKKRWGSCSRNTKIVFNTELIKAPIHCIDYVLVHELCHLVFPNHDNRFFKLLNRLMPDWQRRKERLERVVL